MYVESRLSDKCLLEMKANADLVRTAIYLSSSYSHKS